MADSTEIIENKLREITECSICFKPFTDPRMLPCIHTFCLDCLNKTGDFTKKNRGEKLPCPLCRKEFSIPENGMTGLKKNFFVDNLMEVKKMIQLGKTSKVFCDVCLAISKNAVEKEIHRATHRCLECQENFCDSCSIVHKNQKLTQSHTVVKIGNENEEELFKSLPTKKCTTHEQKPLDYYCTQCKTVVCVSCFVETHSLHGCKDVITLGKEFREIIEKKASKLRDLADKMYTKAKLIDHRKTQFLNNASEIENSILKRNKELKEMIERETESLLKELSSTKEEYLKKIQLQIEDIERSCVGIQNMEIYCSELISKGSASDICGCVDEILKKLAEIDKETASCRRTNKTLEVSLVTDTLENLVGKIRKDEYSTCVVLIGISDRLTITKDFVKVDLHDIGFSCVEPFPSPELSHGLSADVYRNSVFVVGTGKEWNEIWKHDRTSGWIKCASLVEGRNRHSVAFVDEVLYICGGIRRNLRNILYSVEGYNVNSKRCTTLGKLVWGIQSASNCVSFKNFLYIFGGSDESDKNLDHVQKYDIKQNTCTLLTKPMPRPYKLMRAALWNTSVILLGHETCFIFSLETETWEEREQFKTDVLYFGLILEDKNICVIGGGTIFTDAFGSKAKKCRDDIRYVPVMDIMENKPADWKVLTRLPMPTLVQAHAKIKFFSR